MPLDRQGLKRELYRLTNWSDSDELVTENDASSLENVWQLLEQGALDAQLWLLTHARPNRWLATTAALTVQGADSDPGGRYIDLDAAAPEFLRLAGSRHRSALYVPSGSPHVSPDWGTEVEREDGRGLWGDYYWLEGADDGGSAVEIRIRLARQASVPTGLVADYYRRIAWPDSDGVDVDFPRDDWRMIVGEAASTASAQVAFDYEDRQRAVIEKYLAEARTKAKRRARLTQSARRIRRSRLIGTHWFGGSGG